MADRARVSRAHTNVTDDDYIWVADWTTDRLIKYDLDGRYILDIGEHGPLPGQFGFLFLAGCGPGEGGEGQREQKEA